MSAQQARAKRGSRIHTARRHMLAFATCVPLVALVASAAHAEPTMQRLEGRLSTGSVSVREDLLVPYAFTGPALSFGAGYGLTHGPHAFELALELGSSPVRSRMHDSGVYVHYELGVGYAVRILRRERNVLWLGALTRATHELALLDSWDDAHGYWLDAVMLGPALRHAARIAQRFVLELRCDLSLLGMASRPPARRLNKQDALNRGIYHFNRLGQNPGFAFLGQTSFARLEALVRFRARPDALGTGLGLGLETRLAHAREPQPFTSWYTGILVSFPWSWP